MHVTAGINDVVAARLADIAAAIISRSRSYGATACGTFATKNFAWHFFLLL
jgi:hypothetical protein